MTLSAPLSLACQRDGYSSVPMPSSVGITSARCLLGSSSLLQAGSVRVVPKRAGGRASLLRAWHQHRHGHQPCHQSLPSPPDFSLFLYFPQLGSAPSRSLQSKQPFHSFTGTSGPLCGGCLALGDVSTCSSSITYMQNPAMQVSTT